MSRLNLAGYRMEKAKEILDDAEYAFQKSRFMVSVNRSYYAMFTAGSKSAPGTGRKGFQ